MLSAWSLTVKKRCACKRTRCKKIRFAKVNTDLESGGVESIASMLIDLPKRKKRETRLSRRATFIEDRNYGDSGGNYPNLDLN